MASDYEMASEASSLPSSPFSLVSAHPSEDYSDLDLATDSDVSLDGTDTDDLDVHSVSGSEQDWGFVQGRANNTHSRAASVLGSSVVDTSSTSSTISRTPSPGPDLLASTASSPPITPRARSPQLLQLPISDPSAPAFTLVRLLNLPPYYTLNDLVVHLTKSGDLLQSTFGYNGRIPSPLWISFRPPLGTAPDGRSTPTQQSADAASSSALIRFLNPEDTTYLSEMFDHMKNRLMTMEEVGEPWYWLLDLDIILLSDDEAEKGEEGKGLLWVADWLRDDESNREDTVKLNKKAASDLITTILVTPLPSQMKLADLVDLFVNHADSAAKPHRVSLLPDLAAHTIFLSCGILQYPDWRSTEQAMNLLSKYETIFFEPILGVAGGARCSFSPDDMAQGTRKCKVEFKPGDWWNYATSINGAEMWEHSSLVPKQKLRRSPSPDDIFGNQSNYYRPNGRGTENRRWAPSSAAINPAPGGPSRTTRMKANSVMLVGLPQDIPLTEIVKVYTTPPIISAPNVPSHPTPVPSASNQMDVEPPANDEQQTAPFEDLLQAVPTIHVPLPITISVMDSHPVLSPLQRISIMTFRPSDNFNMGISLLPPSLWYRPQAVAGCGTFIKPDERIGNEQLFYPEYKYGEWADVHTQPVQGKQTWNDWRVSQDA